jgi:hypothetical protein
MRDFGYFMAFIQAEKGLIGVASTMIGIKLWFAPQISEHCPVNKPDRVM